MNYCELLVALVGLSTSLSHHCEDHWEDYIDDG